MNLVTGGGEFHQIRPFDPSTPFISDRTGISNWVGIPSFLVFR